MPNRILHERICVSDTLAQLSGDEERLFYRLIVQCDDYGRFDGRVSVIRARCFPLQLDLVTDAWILVWLGRLVDVGLVALYEVEGQAFLRVVSWTRYQYPRAKHSKFPDPTNGLHESAGTCKQTPADSLVNDTGNVNEERRTKNEERKRSSTPLPPPPHAEEGELAEPTTADVALWSAARERLKSSMSRGNWGLLVEPLQPRGRSADGGLRLRAPPGYPSTAPVAHVRKALEAEGDAHADLAAIVGR